MLYQLSYVGASDSRTRMERETGFEPATNSLEGCDSTPELLPHDFDRLARVQWWAVKDSNLRSAKREGRLGVGEGRPVGPEL